MYNENQKKRYLKYCAGLYEAQTVSLIELIFNSTEIVEDQRSKDACDFNQIDVTDYLKGLDSKSRRRLQSTCIRLSKYHEWCYNIEHLTNNIQNPFDSRGIELVIDGILPKSDLNGKYFTKEEYLKMLEKIIDVSNKFITHAIFLGLTIEELINLKMEDLDFETNKLRLNSGRVIIVDALFKHLMIETDDQIQYFADGIEKESRVKAYDYASSEYVIKSCGKKTSGTVSPQYITNRMKTIKEQSENEFMSVSTLYKNGMINYIKEQYAKKDIDLKTAITHPIDGKKYTYDKETQQYINEFGSKMTIRFLRMEIKDYLDLL